ncbi:calcium-binding protein [Bradyrhizobium sp. 149]|uniref:calcium-binding protein n=1 Tax=Bradyrhizobium sp. 149 TaxID=2782624 RepID=UPI001FF9C58B|nr:calcium-binding protein [Bradyrhizobium sp. 149]MCK1655276.1 calcium-binding protein [Bradyrhizobium sp. 149]
MATLHYAAGGGLDSQGSFAPAEAGFNLADVQYVDQVNALPDGVQGLVWLDQYQGATQEFIDQVTPFLNNPKVFGFYLVDEPDLTGEWGPQASAADLKAESDWIHQHDLGAKTFTVLMNTGSSDDPNYMNTYNAANTHIDYFGLDWYPVWSDRSNVDLSTIDKYVSAAEQAGISLESIVPVYQAFGGGDWSTETGSKVVMPTAAQEQAMIDHWAQLVPNPAFDYAYAWGSQNGDTALESSPELQQVFLAHNTSDGTSTGGTTAPPVTDPVTDTPPVDAGGSSGTDGKTPPPVDSGGSTGTGDTTPPVADAGGSIGSTPSVSGSDGTTDSGSWGDHHHGGWSDGSSSFTVGGDGGHNHGRGGLDFSQWLNAGTSSAATGDHSWWRGPTATSNTSADADSRQTDTPDTGSFVAHVADLMSHHSDHHAWHS